MRTLMLRAVAGVCLWANFACHLHRTVLGFIFLLSASAGMVLAQSYPYTYQIVNRQSGKVLDVTGGGGDQALQSGTLIQQWGYLGGENQQWRLTPTDSGYFQIVNRQSGKVLDVIGGSGPQAFQDTTQIQQYD